MLLTVLFSLISASCHAATYSPSIGSQGLAISPSTVTVNALYVTNDATIGSTTTFQGMAGFTGGNGFNTQVTVAGSSLSVTGGASFATLSGNVGVGTASPGAGLDVNSASQYGNGATKSTITASGSINLASGANITGLGSTWVSVATGAVTQGKFGDDRVAITTGGITGGFNAASQLVQMTAGGLYPTASGANITSLTPGNVSAGSLPSNVIASSVAASGVGNSATYGSATQSAQVTVNVDGRVTSAANVTISGTAPGGSAGGDLTGTYPNPTLKATQGNVTTLTSALTVSAASTTIRSAGTTDLCLDNNATGTQAWDIRAGQIVNGDFSIGYRTSGCTGTYTPVMLSSTSGNTGFGTTSPLATLSVAGTFSGTGAATFGSSTTVNGAAQFGSGVAVTSFTATGFLIPTGWTSTQLSPAGAAPAPGSIGVMTRNSTINDMCISTGTAAGNWALFGSKGTGGCF